MADCLSNLNKADDALSMADKAASASDDAYTTYYFTKKASLSKNTIILYPYSTYEYYIIKYNVIVKINGLTG